MGLQAAAKSETESVSRSVVSDSVTPLCSPPGSSVTGFPRQEDWSGLPFPSPGDLPGPEMEPTFHVLGGRSVTAEPPGRPGGGIRLCVTLSVQSLTQSKASGSPHRRMCITEERSFVWMLHFVH